MCLQSEIYDFDLFQLKSSLIGGLTDSVSQIENGIVNSQDKSRENIYRSLGLQGSTRKCMCEEKKRPKSFPLTGIKECLFLIIEYHLIFLEANEIVSRGFVSTRKSNDS